MVTALYGQGEFGERDLMDNQVTFMASIFRSIRFGSEDAHGRANLIRFNFFKEQGAFTRDEATGTSRDEQAGRSELSTPETSATPHAEAPTDETTLTGGTSSGERAARETASTEGDDRTQEIDRERIAESEERRTRRRRRRREERPDES